MFVREVKKLNDFTVEDFGLKSSDSDSHTPSMFIIRKSPKLSHADLHSRSEIGKQADKLKTKLKRKDNRKLQKRHSGLLRILSCYQVPQGSTQHRRRSIGALHRRRSAGRQA